MQAEQETRIDRGQADRGVLRDVAWQDVLPWLALVRVFRLATRLRSIALATLGVALTGLVWWLLATLFAADPWVASVKQAFENVMWTFPYRAPVHVTPDASTPLPPLVGPRGDAIVPGAPSNPVTGVWQNLSAVGAPLFSLEVSFVGFTFALLCVMSAVAVWAFFGGAITRIAAVQFAREEPLATGAAVRFACRKWPALFAAPLLPLLGIFFPLVGLFIVGLIMRADIGVLLAAIVWPLLLLVGLLMAILSIGLLLGWPLMWPTIGAEGTDSFDALSRAYSYSFQRPFRYLFYALVASFLGWIAWLIVLLFLGAVSHLTFWGVSWGMGNERFAEVFTEPTEARQEAPAAVAPNDNNPQWIVPMPPEGAIPTPPDFGPYDSRPEYDRYFRLLGDRRPLMTIPAPRVMTDRDAQQRITPEPVSTPARYGYNLIAFWLGCLRLVALGFAYSYFWNAVTVIYFLLRRDVDGAELDEVFLDAPEAPSGAAAATAGSVGIANSQSSASAGQASAPPAPNDTQPRDLSSE